MMKITNLTTDEAALVEFGRRMAEVRLARQLTQAQLAGAAGVSKRTIERLEDGASTQFGNLIRCLRALDKLEGLDRLVPETPPNPIALLERHGKARQRARPADTPEPTPPWTWGDEQ
jgi:transcriptional regulator with XRE-family HTH domain